MTDNEIIKALEICTSEHLGCEDDCPYATNGLTYSQCKNTLAKDVLDLLNRKDAEIEKKDTEIDILIRKKHALRDEIEEKEAEIERLRQKIKEIDEHFCEGEIGKGMAIVINLAKELTESKNDFEG